LHYCLIAISAKQAADSKMIITSRSRGENFGAPENYVAIYNFS